MKFIKRLTIYIGGLLLLAIGINISKAAGLGISPVSAVPYALEVIWGLELGLATIFFQVALVFLQVLLLQKKFKPVQFLQIPCVYLLSFFITYTSSHYLLSWLPEPPSYGIRLLYLLISIIIIGIGVSLYLLPNFVPLPAEGLMKAIVTVSHDRFKFSHVKVAVDSSLVLISAILSFVFLGSLITVREGTVLAAILVGEVVGFVYKHYRKQLSAWLEE